MKKNNKGFTLVELIVVLVILAILAAILVPALLGYIDRAREKQYVLDAKSALTAAQAELSSIYGEGGNLDSLTAARLNTIKTTADNPTGSKFTFYTGKELTATTSAVSGEHLAYTVKGAIYIPADTTDVYLAFNGSSWVSYPTEAEAQQAAETLGVTAISAY